MKNFLITVIIPVYNAAGFVAEAVESALAQPETAEVILIEDGSPDDSLAVCQALAEKYDKVRLLRHPGGKNRGAGASRNLGMKHAQFEYIAFLDADDYFLPGRFDTARKILKKTRTLMVFMRQYKVILKVRLQKIAGFRQMLPNLYLRH